MFYWNTKEQAKSIAQCILGTTNVFNESKTDYKKTAKIGINFARLTMEHLLACGIYKLNDCEACWEGQLIGHLGNFKNTMGIKPGRLGDNTNAVAAVKSSWDNIYQGAIKDITDKSNSPISNIKDISMFDLAKIPLTCPWTYEDFAYCDVHQLIKLTKERM